MLRMNKIVSFLLIFFISGSFVTVFNPVSAKELVENSWNTKASMCYPRESLGVVAVDGKIYAIGGYRGYQGYYFDFLDINECYDPKADTWTTLKPMPTPRSSFAIAAYEGKIYCIGGVIGTSDNGYAGASANEVYDIVTDSWSVKTSAPFKLGKLSAHVINGKIFVITHLSELYMYDPFTDIWTKKTNMPSPIAHDSSAVIDDSIIVIQRISTSDYDLESRLRIYDTKTDTLCEGNALNHFIPIHDVAGVTTGVYAPQRVYVLCGRYDTNYLSTCVYNPVKDTWSTAQKMPSDRIKFGVAVIDDLLYVIGGYSNGILALNEQYVPIGYKDAIPAPSEHILTYIAIAILTLTIGSVVVANLFFYFNKKKKMGEFSPIER